MKQWEKYWTMCIPDAGYEHQSSASGRVTFVRLKDCPDAQKLLLEEFPCLTHSGAGGDLDERSVQTVLLQLFQSNGTDTNRYRQA
ncbi:MAG: hypothetical protein AB4042_09120 [Leptolyngbyaceae cyanobacterium]